MLSPVALAGSTERWRMFIFITLNALLILITAHGSIWPFSPVASCLPRPAAA